MFCILYANIYFIRYRYGFDVTYMIICYLSIYFYPVNTILFIDYLLDSFKINLKYKYFICTCVGHYTDTRCTSERATWLT